jgi:transcriptional regulator with XRE-family HTH domain
MRQGRRASAVVTNDYGDLLAKIRDEMGWTQSEFADAVGLSRETISRAERGAIKVPPGPETLSRMANISGHTVAEFLVALHYDLTPLLPDGATPTAERLALLRAGTLAADEEELVVRYRRLPSPLRRVILRQVDATLPDPLRSAAGNDAPAGPRSKSKVRQPATD